MKWRVYFSLLDESYQHEKTTTHRKEKEFLSDVQHDSCTLILKQLPITQVPGECQVLPQQNWNDSFFCNALLGKRVPMGLKCTVNQTLTEQKECFREWVYQILLAPPWSMSQKGKWWVRVPNPLLFSFSHYSALWEQAGRWGTGFFLLTIVTRPTA